MNFVRRRWISMLIVSHSLHLHLKVDTQWRQHQEMQTPRKFETMSNEIHLLFGHPSKKRVEFRWPVPVLLVFTSPSYECDQKRCCISFTSIAKMIYFVLQNTIPNTKELHISFQDFLSLINGCCFVQRVIWGFFIIHLGICLSRWIVWEFSLKSSTDPWKHPTLICFVKVKKLMCFFCFRF